MYGQQPAYYPMALPMNGRSQMPAYNQVSPSYPGTAEPMNGQIQMPAYNQASQAPISDKRKTRGVRNTEELSADSGDESEGADFDDGVVVESSHRAHGIAKAATETMLEEGTKKSGRFTANIQALVLTSFLFALITAVQTWAAIKANSKALLMDCVSMGVDALTYLGNIVVECKKRDGAEHARSQLVACAISLSILTYFTYTIALESWDTVKVCQHWTDKTGTARALPLSLVGNAPLYGAANGTAPGADEEPEVDGRITLIFAIGGIVFDLISMWAFYRSNKKTGSVKHLNMFTALLHVGADFLRSTSTFVMSLLILVGGFDSTCLDAYTSLIIGASIVCGGLFGIYQWFTLLAKVCSGKAS